MSLRFYKRVGWLRYALISRQSFVFVVRLIHVVQGARDDIAASIQRRVQF